MLKHTVSHAGLKLVYYPSSASADVIGGTVGSGTAARLAVVVAIFTAISNKRAWLCRWRCDLGMVSIAAVIA